MVAAGAREAHPTSGRSCNAHQNKAVGCGCGEEAVLVLSVNVALFTS